MASDGGRWARLGRRRRDRDDHGGEDDYGDHSGHNGRDAAYPDADGYGRRAEYGSDGGYGSDDGYGWPGGHGQASGYGGPASYDSASGYGDQASYADPRGYGDQPGWGDPDGYGTQNGYRDRDGYGDRTGYGGQAGYGETGGYGPQEGYGGPGGHQWSGGQGGHEGYGEPGYAEPGYDESGYGGPGDYGAPDVDTNPYGPGSHGSADRPDQASGYQWQGPYGAADPLPPASYDPGPSHDAAGSARGYDTGSFGRADTGSHASWAFTPGARGYDSDPLDQGSEGLSDSPADGFGPDSGSFGRPDTGRPDTGSFGRPDTGSFGRPDTGSFGRPDTGSFGRPDTGSFRRSDSGTFGRPDDQATSARRALPAGSGGYADWRDEPVDDDWEDDADGGLLSRRFGRSGRRERGDGGRGRARGRKPRRLRGKAAFTMAILTVALVTGIAAAFGYKYVHTWINNRYGDYTGAGTGTVEITVKSGDTLAGLGPVLVRDGVIMALRHYDTAAAAASGTLQPGVYSLHHHMNSAIAVKYLLDPKHRSDIKVTIIEGQRAHDIAALLARKTGLKESDFVNLINHPPASLGLPSWAAGKPAEGFLFPDTYTFVPGESALKILQTMVSNFNNKVATIHLASAAPLVHTTPWHVLIVASMAQAEGGLDDFGKVARVAWNRLGQNMALHFDSTVFYGLGIPGNQQAAATSAEIKKDNPYNTYIHTGLPPGPIGNPGLKAIQAALHPTHGPWLYFITDLKTKKTYFTASYTQFLQWEKKF